MLARAAALLLQREAQRRVVALDDVLHRRQFGGARGGGGGGLRRRGLERGGVLHAQRRVERGRVVARLALLEHHHLQDGVL